MNEGNLSLHNLTLTGGNAAAYSDGTGGLCGAILNTGTLAINCIAFTKNSAGAATGDDGGAIYNGSGTILDLSDSTFSGNHAFEGSAIYNGGTGTLGVRYSTFSANTASNAGAIYNGGSAVISVANSTLASNIASGNGGVGGGIVNDGTLTATNTLIQDDASGAECGAILNGGHLTISSSTFQNNTGRNGGAILNSPGAVLTVTGSTFANNSPGQAVLEEPSITRPKAPRHCSTTRSLGTPRQLPMAVPSSITGH